MNLFEFLIIYLACGAPVAVNYYFQNQARRNEKIAARAFFVFLGWLPFFLNSSFPSAFRWLKRGGEINEDFYSFSVCEEKIYSTQKQLENIFLASGLELTVFEFREIVERYIGLSVAAENETSRATAAEEKVFHIAGLKKVELPALCLHRRNGKRLVRHQSQARRDFLQLIANLSVSHSNCEKLCALAIKFVTLLNDAEAEKSIRDLLPETAELNDDFAAANSEKILWNTEEPSPTLAKQISFPLKNLTATAVSSNKD